MNSCLSESELKLVSVNPEVINRGKVEKENFVNMYPSDYVISGLF